MIPPELDPHEIILDWKAEILRRLCEVNDRENEAARDKRSHEKILEMGRRAVKLWDWEGIE